MNEAGLGPSSASSQMSDSGKEPLYALRQVREAAGLHIAALAAALKVPVRKLEALEAGRYDELPDLTFARALASSACRHLKVDAKPILDQIPQRHKPTLGDVPRAINAPFKASAPGSVSGAPSWWARPSVIIAGLLFAAALALLLLPDSVRLPTVDELTSSSAGQRVEVLQQEMPFPPADPDGGSPPELEAGGTADEAAAASLSVPAPALPGESATAEVPANAANAPNVPNAVSTESGQAPSLVASDGTVGSSALLNITATAETWVEVRNGQGAVVTQRLLKSGDVIEFSSAPPYRVLLGRAEAATVLVRGQPFDVMPFARNNVARFEAR